MTTMHRGSVQEFTDDQIDAARNYIKLHGGKDSVEPWVTHLARHPMSFERA